jgi:hypothetical protein
MAAAKLGRDIKVSEASLCTEHGDVNGLSAYVFFWMNFFDTDSTGSLRWRSPKGHEKGWYKNPVELYRNFLAFRVRHHKNS